jgi:hypothetical protein
VTSTAFPGATWSTGWAAVRRGMNPRRVVVRGGPVRGGQHAGVGAATGAAACFVTYAPMSDSHHFRFSQPDVFREDSGFGEDFVHHNAHKTPQGPDTPRELFEYRGASCFCVSLGARWCWRVIC